MLNKSLFFITFEGMKISLKNVFTAILIICTFMISSSCKKRCPIKSCQTKMIHEHGGVKGKVRGMPWWKKQNPRTGELNPDLNRDGKTY